MAFTITNAPRTTELCVNATVINRWCTGMEARQQVLFRNNRKVQLMQWRTPCGLIMMTIIIFIVVVPVLSPLRLRSVLWSADANLNRARVLSFPTEILSFVSSFFLSFNANVHFQIKHCSSCVRVMSTVPASNCFRVNSEIPSLMANLASVKPRVCYCKDCSDECLPCQTSSFHSRSHTLRSPVLSSIRYFRLILNSLLSPTTPLGGGGGIEFVFFQK